MTSPLGQEAKPSVLLKWSFFLFCFVLFFLSFVVVVIVVIVVVAISWAAPAAYGGSQARG